MSKTLRSNFKDQNCLVIGGAGFIGSHFAEELLNRGAAEVVIVDNLFNGFKRNLPQDSKLSFYELDAEDRTALGEVLTKHKITVVCNFATKALNNSFVDPEETFFTNLEVMANLLEFQREKRFRSLLHISSSEVYGSAVFEPMTEEHPLEATTTYAAGKASADLLLKSYVAMFALDAVIVRPFNNYGPKQNYEDPLAALIPRSIARIIRKQPLEIQGSGNQKRDFIFVKDTVKIIADIYPQLVCARPVNISSSGQLSVLDVVKVIQKEMNSSESIVFKERRVADLDSHRASNEYLKSFGKFHETSFDQGIKETIKYYRELLANDPNHTT